MRRGPCARPPMVLPFAARINWKRPHTVPFNTSSAPRNPLTGGTQMLYFDSALELEGVTVFRDFNTPTKFYYMPRAPRLTTEAGAPMFQLLIYRRDITDNPDFKA